jgi:hypothetical protein
MKGENMKNLLFIVLLVAVLLTAGCTNDIKNVAVAPALTVIQTSILPVSAVPTLAEKPTQDDTDDKKFLDAVEICYKNTPVIMDSKTNMEFTICMQHTPIPTGKCAKIFRSEIFRYATKDDITTAGLKRMNNNMQVTRAAFYNNTTWDSSIPPDGGWVKC